MAISAAELKTRFENIIDDAPNKLTLTIGAATYDAVKTVISREIQYSEFGVQSGYSFSVILKKDDLPSVPIVDSFVSVGGETYRIIGTETDSADVAIRLDLGQEYA